MTSLEVLGATLLAVVNLFIAIFAIMFRNPGLLIFLGINDVLLGLAWFKYGAFWNDPPKLHR